MPSTSKKQHNFMAAVAKNPAFAKKAGVPQSVGQDFLNADKGRKFAKGGVMKESKEMMKKELAFMKKKGAPKAMMKHEKAEAGYKRGGSVGMGSVRTAAPSRDGIASKGKTKGTQIKMKSGGKCM